MGKPKKKQSTSQIAQRIVTPILDQLGLQLWDIRFEKEGSSWFLRFFIDRENGVSIGDCEAVSRRVEAILDAEDPIQVSYVLEVSSPGIERELAKDHHFQRYIGEMVAVKLMRPVEGQRDFIGKLISKEADNVTILLDDDISMTYSLNEAAYTRLHVDFE